MKTLVAVTTCPRPDGVSYLERTLASIERGPDDELVVFDDPELRGSRWNTWRALELGGSYDRLLLFQDDLIAQPWATLLMRTIDIPDDVGVVNLHDCGDDFLWQEPPAGIHKFPAHRPGGLGMIGSQCLVIPGEHSRWLAAQDMAAPPSPGPHADDFAIGWWTAQSQRPNKLVVYPSPVRHIGERSACHDKLRSKAGIDIPHAGRTVADLLRRRAS